MKLVEKEGIKKIVREFTLENYGWGKVAGSYLKEFCSNQEIG